MAERYFDKFKKIYYANTLSIDITERAVVLNSVNQNPYLFYPYDISNEIRAEQIADRYYEDQYMSWLVYFGNKTIDPYYDWYLSEREFDAVLRKKYGQESYILQNKVKFYRNNWLDPGNNSIPPAVFDGLTDQLKRFWTPEYGENGKLIAYVRKQEDWVINTNGWRQYTSTETCNTFIKDEIVDIVFDQNHTGQGQVLICNSTSVTLQHYSGFTVANSTVTISGSSYLQGQESNTIVSFATSKNMLDNIPLEEYVYWTPVSIYEYENELNSRNKNIRLIDNRYAMKAAKQLKSLLK
jgi:hypothetical protein